MACDIANGRALVCKDQIGGLKAIYFINNQIAATDITYDVTNTDLITAITNVDSLYKYELKATGNTYVETITSARDNGTTFFQQVLSIQLPKLTTADHKIVKLLAYGNPHIVIQNNNDQFFIAGLLRGMDVTGGSIETGGGLGDFSGYKLTFTGEEGKPASLLNASAEAAMVTLFTAATLVTS